MTDDLIEIAARALRRNRFERNGVLSAYNPGEILTKGEIADATAVIDAVEPLIRAAALEEAAKVAMEFRRGSGTRENACIEIFNRTERSIHVSVAVSYANKPLEFSLAPRKRVIVLDDPVGAICSITTALDEAWSSTAEEA